MDQEDKRPPLTLAETASELGVTNRVARNALSRGQLRGFKIGRYWRILPESVDRLLRSPGENESGT
jgi:excisionase family DNA binding protein